MIVEVVDVRKGTSCQLYHVVRVCVLGESFFFFNDTATTEIYTLSLHDALPIYRGHRRSDQRKDKAEEDRVLREPINPPGVHDLLQIGRAHV